MRLVQMTDSPAVNVLLDIFHGMIEEDDLAGAVRRVGKERLGHYHMGSNNRRPPRPGFLPWQDVCSALKEIGYDGFLTIEREAGATRFDDIKHAVSFLSAILEKLY